MKWIENKIHLLSKLKNCQDYYQDITYLQTVSNRNIKAEMIQAISRMVEKYRVWITDIGQYEHPIIRPTVTEEEYDVLYTGIEKKQLFDQIAWLIRCIVLGACITIGIYGSIQEALTEEKHEQE